MIKGLIEKYKEILKADISFRRGVKESIRPLQEGEPGFTTDEKSFYIGSSGGNVEFINKDKIKTDHYEKGATYNKVEVDSKVDEIRIQYKEPYFSSLKEAEWRDEPAGGYKYVIAHNKNIKIENLNVKFFKDSELVLFHYKHTNNNTIEVFSDSKDICLVVIHDEGVMGPQGPIGQTGPQGQIGPKGDKGLSAYEYAVETGYFTGTEGEWYEFIKGEKGDKGDPIQIDNEFNGGKDKATSSERGLELNRRLNVIEDEMFVSTEFTGERTLTANNTIDGVTRGIEIKGETLHNVGLYKNALDITTANGNTETNLGFFGKKTPNILLKPNVIYTVFATGFSSSITECYITGLGMAWTPANKPTKFTALSGFNISENESGRNIQFKTTRVSTQTDIENGYFMILEGDWSNKEVPEYFEGIQSAYEDNKKETQQYDTIVSCSEGEGNILKVKTTGKNLLDTSKVVGVRENGYILIGNSNDAMIEVELKKGTFFLQIFDVIDYATEGIDILFDVIDDKGNIIHRFKNLWVEGFLEYYKSTFEIFESGTYKIKFFAFINKGCKFKNALLAESTVATDYVPYVEDKAEVQLPCPHRETHIYNGETGKYDESTKVGIIDEISANVQFMTFGSTHTVVRGIKFFDGKRNGFVISTEFKMHNWIWIDSTEEGIRCLGVDGFIICLANTRLSTVNKEGVLQYFKDNPLDIIYELEIPIVHNIEKLRLNAYNEVTYISQESNVCGDMKVKALTKKPIVNNNDITDILEEIAINIGNKKSKDKIMQKINKLKQGE